MDAFDTSASEYNDPSQVVTQGDDGTGYDSGASPTDSFNQTLSALGGAASVAANLWGTFVQQPVPLSDKGALVQQVPVASPGFFDKLAASFQTSKTVVISAVVGLVLVVCTAIYLVTRKKKEA